MLCYLYVLMFKTLKSINLAHFCCAGVTFKECILLTTVQNYELFLFFDVWQCIKKKKIHVA